MSKIDISKWGKFKVGKIFKGDKWIGDGLFRIVNSAPYHEKDVTETKDEGINYVVRSKYNNGVKYKVEKNSDFKINPAKTISFGAENCDFFYQTEEYITGNKMYYIDTSEIDEYACLFFINVLQKTFNERYSFSDGMIPSQIYNKEIQLPVDDTGNPDWEYMSSFMKKIEKVAKERIDLFKSVL
ncbi:MAG: restriction endonuclease subunit S [Acholeplasmatales bacterium]|nr:restriction endonuclease subunit S [Acholeplasmatales bacterium]